MSWRDVITALPLAAFSEGGAQEVARRLVQHAARNAPPALSERLEEEWLADLATRTTAMARLRFGLGCCWAIRVIAHDFCANEVRAAAPAPATVPATGQKIMTAYAQPNVPLFSRRTTIFVLIVGLHVFLVYALQTGLHRGNPQVLPSPFEAKFLPETVKPQDPPPPPPDLDLNPTPIEMVPPEFPLDVPASTNAIQPVVPAIEQPVTTAPVQPVIVKRVPGGPGKAFPNTEDYYPPASIRMNEEGVAIASVCVDERGKLTEDPVIARSSGSTRLDGGALKLARAGSGRYRPATEDGWPVSSCFPISIRFELN